MQRETFEKVLEKMQKAKIFHPDDNCEILEEIFQSWGYFDYIEEGLYVDKHRWYELSTSIMQWGEWFIGVRWASDVFSDGMSRSDTGVFVKFFEMTREPVVTFEYTKINT